MKTRDSKGRFSKQETNGGLILAFPALSSILYWIILFLIFLPWLIILSKLSLLEKITILFDSIFKDIERPEPEPEPNKKNGLFY